MSQQKSVAILVGGGPAPGINSVISAATLRSLQEGARVIGILDGFSWVMKGDVEHVLPLTHDEATRIHFRGGSHIGTARANPTRDPQHLENVVLSLGRLGVDQLITIGGDDTAFSAMKVEEKAQGRLRVVHVPKTIDNDLDLPAHVDTFGFQTARHHGAQMVANLMVDARTTSRWYLVIAMGRTAGHLALGMGKAAGAALTLIPEEFEGRVRLQTLADTLVGAIVKRLAHGQRDGVAVLAEGLVLSLDPEELAQFKDVERDEHGHVRIAEIDIGDILKRAVDRRLKELGVKTTVVSKNIGYELRCADPIPFDLEYTRELGCCAAEYLLSGGNAAMVTLQEGRFVPISFRDMLDPKTGRTRVRRVDVRSPRYAIARRFMTRLRCDDLDDPAELARLAATANLSPEEFRTQFGPLVEGERPAS